MTCRLLIHDYSGDLAVLYSAAQLLRGVEEVRLTGRTLRFVSEDPRSVVAVLSRVCPAVLMHLQWADTKAGLVREVTYRQGEVTHDGEVAHAWYSPMGVLVRLWICNG